MRTLLSFLISVAIVGCSSSPTTDSASLYDHYLEYRNLVLADYDRATSIMVSSAFVDFNHTAESNMPKEIRSSFLRELATEIESEHSHHEERKGQVGCLSVNGLDSNQEPETLSLYYAMENGRWVIDNVLIHGHKSESGYYDEAHCPIPE